MTPGAETMDPLRDFYQRHPYPPPVESLDKYRDIWNDKRRRKADYHLFEPYRPFREDRRILIAGCGTPQAAKYAVRWPQSTVTGIDISPTSIEHTLKLKRQYQLDNLEVRELPVERAGDLDTTFDYIVSTGVVHHLADPDAGLTSLAGCLDPDGVLHLMVYAPHGRAGIYLLQDYCRRLGIEPSGDGIAGLVGSLRALPQNHPLVPLLRESPDFRQEAALADALLNPRDRPYSVEQLLDLVDGAGLRFARWVRQAPYLPQCGAVRLSPHRDRLDRLAAPEQFAAMELFRGNMLRHSAVLYHKDRSAPAGPVDFHDAGSGTDPSDWVPIPLPETVCVTEKLPQGASAVLINQAHTQRDIYMPIDDMQLQVFNAIDGERSVAEIAANAEDAGPVHAFLQDLYRHDQIVVDASNWT